MNNTITIKKATLTSGHGLSVEMSERQKDGTYIESKSDYSAPVHSDLKLAFRRMNVHLGLSSEHLKQDEVNSVDSPSEDIVNKYPVNSITFLPDESGVKISGSVELTTEKKMSLTPPAIKWGDEDGYGYASELGEITSLVYTEIEAYLAGKHAPEPQQELPFGEDPEDAR